MQDLYQGFHPWLLSISPSGKRRCYSETRPPNIVANIIICLIHQTNYLLDQLIRRLEKDFLEKGGLKENMFRARLAHRDRNKR